MVLKFASHRKIEDFLGIKYYFTHPHTYWKKGLCEQTNGLLRQHLPRKLHFREIKPALNNRPRQSLNFQSPSEILQKIAVTN
jgi:IS30 family transposase